METNQNINNNEEISVKTEEINNPTPMDIDVTENITSKFNETTTNGLHSENDQKQETLIATDEIKDENNTISDENNDNTNPIVKAEKTSDELVSSENIQPKKTMDSIENRGDVKDGIVNSVENNNIHVGKNEDHIGNNIESSIESNKNQIESIENKVNQNEDTILGNNTNNMSENNKNIKVENITNNIENNKDNNSLGTKDTNNMSDSKITKNPNAPSLKYDSKTLNPTNTDNNSTTVNNSIHHDNKDPSTVGKDFEAPTHSFPEDGSQSNSTSHLPFKQQYPDNIDPAVVGAPVRRYLNEKVTPALLEGMRRLAKEKPENALKYLGEFLIEKSKMNQN